MHGAAEGKGKKSPLSNQQSLYTSAAVNCHMDREIVFSACFNVKTTKDYQNVFQRQMSISCGSVYILQMLSPWRALFKQPWMSVQSSGIEIKEDDYWDQSVHGKHAGFFNHCKTHCGVLALRLCSAPHWSSHIAVSVLVFTHDQPEWQWHLWACPYGNHASPSGLCLSKLPLCSRKCPAVQLSTRKALIYPPSISPIDWTAGTHNDLYMQINRQEQALCAGRLKSSE